MDPAIICYTFLKEQPKAEPLVFLLEAGRTFPGRLLPEIFWWKRQCERVSGTSFVFRVWEDKAPDECATRELMVTAKSPGVTFIEVFAPGSSTTVITKLEVRVKDKVSHTIAFHLGCRTMTPGSPYRTSLAVS